MLSSRSSVMRISRRRGAWRNDEVAVSAVPSPVVWLASPSGVMGEQARAGITSSKWPLGLLLL